MCRGDFSVILRYVLRSQTRGPSVFFAGLALNHSAASPMAHRRLPSLIMQRDRFAFVAIGPSQDAISTTRLEDPARSELDIGPLSRLKTLVRRWCHRRIDASRKSRDLRLRTNQHRRRVRGSFQRCVGAQASQLAIEHAPHRVTERRISVALGWQHRAENAAHACQNQTTHSPHSHDVNAADCWSRVVAMAAAAKLGARRSIEGCLELWRCITGASARVKRTSMTAAACVLTTERSR